MNNFFGINILCNRVIIPFFSINVLHGAHISFSFRFHIRRVCIITCVAAHNPYFFNRQNKRIQPLYLAATIDASDVYV